MSKDFKLEGYNYELPEENIAQHPVEQRDNSRLLVFHTATHRKEHRRFGDIADYIRDEDMLVVNDTRVFPARLHGRKKTGGKVEVFLLCFPRISEIEPGKATVEALLKSSKRPKVGSSITISEDLCCMVKEYRDDGKAELDLHFPEGHDLSALLATCGQVPLPPYISREKGTTAEDVSRYQTVYADAPGAVAAPTAGLHFTDTLLESLTERGINFGTITLHVGYGTFAPVRSQEIRNHSIHGEYVSVSKATIAQIEETKKRGGKIWAVGTTTVRALEFAAISGELQPVADWCELYIYPGFQFRVIDNLITNFHLPQSSLMFLVSAMCGRENLLDCYREAIERGYRFYSYGDAMAVIGNSHGS